MFYPPILRRALHIALSASLFSGMALAQNGLGGASVPIQTVALEKTAQAKDSITFHGGAAMDYTSTAGKLLIRDDNDEPVAEMFYVAYTQNGADGAKRPITFMWDGGPGGATTAGNYLGFGPMRYSSAQREQPLAPYTLKPNEHSLLQYSDLVFLDPIGTGYSRAVGKAKDSDFWGVDSDADATSRAIARYLYNHNRWHSPKFILGISYGTTRAAVVSNMLQSRGVALNGVILVASALNFGAFSNGMDHQHLVNLPTMAAVAWYHNKTAHQSKSLPELMDEVREFARGDYAQALYQGNEVSPEVRDDIAQRLSGYIGLSQDYIQKAHLRVSVIRFRKELLRNEEKVIGRMDGRTLMTDFDHVGEEPETDYWMFNEYLMPVNAVLQDFLASRLGYRTEQKYWLVAEGAIQAWDWTHKMPPVAGISQREYDERNIFPQNTWVGADLGVAMRGNPHLQVFQLNGYYDFATPFAMAEYDLSHMTFDKKLQNNITSGYYEVGHGAFMDDEALPLISQDLGKFYAKATGGQ